VTLVLHTVPIFRSAPETARFAETPQIRAFLLPWQHRSHPKIKLQKEGPSCPAIASARALRLVPCPRVLTSAIASSEQTPKPALAAARQASLDREETRSAKASARHAGECAIPVRARNSQTGWKLKPTHVGHRPLYAGDPIGSPGQAGWWRDVTSVAGWSLSAATRNRAFFECYVCKGSSARL